MDSLLTHCASFLPSSAGLIGVFFLGGLTGSLTHCVSMCGPVVACQAACTRNCGARAGFQWLYHLGRSLTYGTLGFAAALLARQIASYAFWPQLSAFMLIAAGIMFVLSALPLRKHALFHSAAGTPLLRGILMGFMPCGLVYAALMMAATLANPWLGMAAMWIFALGTMPALWVAGVGAAYISQRWRRTMGVIGRATMALNGFSLLFLAGRMMR